jgi:hypothetical protein
MKKGFRCLVETPEIKRLLCNLSEARGYAKSNFDQINETKKKLFYCDGVEGIFAGLADTGSFIGTNLQDYKDISIEEMINQLKQPKSAILDDIAGERVIIRLDGSVTYGCTTLNATTVDIIIAEREKIYKKAQT